MENYALFSLPPIFTNILYTYALRYIVYLGEPSGNIISNYYGTLYTYSCMHIIPYIKRKIPNRLFSLFIQENLYQRPTLLNSSPTFLNFDTLNDTVSKKISTKKIY